MVGEGGGAERAGWARLAQLARVEAAALASVALAAPPPLAVGEGARHVVADHVEVIAQARLPGAHNLPTVLERAGASVQAVLQRTHASGRRELCLVQSQAELLEPQVLVRAEALQ